MFLETTSLPIRPKILNIFLINHLYTKIFSQHTKAEVLYNTYDVMILCL